MYVPFSPSQSEVSEWLISYSNNEWLLPKCMQKQSILKHLFIVEITQTYNSHLETVSYNSPNTNI